MRTSSRPSVGREVAAWTAGRVSYVDNLQWVYQPDYDPATIETPRDYAAVLGRKELV
jgi:hypothetical protein